VLELRHDLRLSTQVSVLPQVVARACLLELSQEDLEDHIRERLDENPALELVERDPAGRAAPAGRPERGGEDLCARLPAPFSLRDDLLWQLRAACSGRRFSVAAYIVENLDERGYLGASVVELAGDLRVPEAAVEEALSLVQTLDPPGIAARDLRECLRLQVLALPPGASPPGMLDFLDGEFAPALLDFRLAGDIRPWVHRQSGLVGKDPEDEIQHADVLVVRVG